MKILKTTSFSQLLCRFNKKAFCQTSCVGRVNFRPIYNCSKLPSVLLNTNILQQQAAQSYSCLPYLWRTRDKHDCIHLKRHTCNCCLIAQAFSTSNSTKDKEKVSVSFIMPGGERVTVSGKEGDSLYDLVLDNDVDIDGFGACEATLACSTCHLIFSKEDYEKLPETPTDEELDMLDLAFGLTETSRLGCQVTLTKDLDGIVVMVPTDRKDSRDV